MSWVLRRWLNSSSEEQNSPSPPETPNTTSTLQLSQQHQQQQQQQQQQLQQKQTQPSLIPNNQKILLGGLLFLSLSTLVTRRSLARKHLNSIPPFYTSSVYHKPYVNSAFEAFEALNIATINVFSIAITAFGGAMCAFDVNTIEEARAKARAGMGIANGVPPTEEEEKQFEQDMEEFLAKMLDKKDIAEVRKRIEAARSKGKKE